MDARSSAAAESAAHELVVTRVFNASRDIVWKALTEPERLEQWWGPRGFTSRVHQLDLRPGGIFLYSQRTPDGHEIWGKWVYREVAAPERLLVVSSFSDNKGNLVRSPFAPNWPLEMLTESIFTEHGGRTTITIRITPINATESERKTFGDGRNSMEQGFASTFEKLDQYLATL
jgi:uncharacterized protein YndB with AHSA1/START domain